ncbi:hypothetical protein [Okeania sp. SIO2G5]|uniref:hypothetical protein n=1 Tax=Okeania sp. SIO2G5 TaxID=2607796 RepID=UPI0013BFBCC9|nr:hypothetical protein [Okeania sp. SIO2G5]NEP76644.1 hypothetical protein [Okeania sp. SIO2G5]
MKLSGLLGLAFGLLWGMAIATQISATEVMQETSFLVAILFGFFVSFLGLFAGKVFSLTSKQK